MTLRLEEWFTSWPVHRSGIAAVGDEGDGKTWALATWLASRFKPSGDGPITLWIPSRDATVDDLSDLIAQNLSKRLGQSSSVGATGWSSGLRPCATTRRCCFSSWTESTNAITTVVASSCRRTGCGAVGTRHRSIVTTRPSYWPKVAGYSHIKWLQVQVSEYDEAELETALSEGPCTRTPAA